MRAGRPQSLQELSEEYLEVERSMERERSSGSDRARALAELIDRRRRLLGWAGSRLPASGPTADWFHAALDGAWGEPLQRFAIDVLGQAGRYPRRYLEGAVRWAIRAEAVEPIRKGSAQHGAVAVFDAMTTAATRGELGYARRRLLQYYVVGRSDEDPTLVEAAFRRLQDATFRVSDAPPGARRAPEEP